ncbi:MAG: hypothetical protein DI552_01830 [Brevundimonas sp.]|jgi:hypothetical protein|uniref:Toprim domain-containing protein n=3 Tax=Brevundimonas TaxID=41275 RepID=A0A7W9F908_9CAUL|nr:MULTISPECIES: toprim domain-containing protein [Brevundimonas]MBB5740666.1 hypothetical protein [Brevundimonas aurantiaca]MBX9709092.1 toprim domain-containing protein [Caulobacteraceae bacterium]PZU61861.1 MAG: hypothetical protein DI552_01830 [Brevundimonas sp.]
MSLRAIVSALGGDLYQNGARANVPAPGHSAADRSISLVLSDGRVVAHGFGAADWRAALDDLTQRGLIDEQRRPRGGGCAASVPHIDLRRRIEAAECLWEGGQAATPAGRAALHLRLRGVPWRDDLTDLRDHPSAPLAVYAMGRRTRGAMLAKISDVTGALTGVEITYLDPNGCQAVGIAAPRKTIGAVPAGSAVRLMAASSRMVVGEGVITTLSAIRRFGRPGWALLSAGNLSRWSPPPGVRDVLIAADNGVAGERAAIRLRARLLSLELDAMIARPPSTFGDWNEADQASAKALEAEEGRGGAPDRRG